MMSTQQQSQATPTTLQSVFRPVLTALACLVKRLPKECVTIGEVEDLQVLLETLPLPSDEFGLACIRLRNAQRYLQAGERGAAKWELNALKQQLCTRLNAECRESRRRKRR